MESLIVVKVVWHEIFSFKFYPRNSFSATRFWASSFILEIVSPGPLSIPVRQVLEFFRKFVEIFVSKGWSPVSITSAINEKKLSQDVIPYFVDMLLGCCLHSYVIFFTKCSLWGIGSVGRIMLQLFHRRGNCYRRWIMSEWSFQEK